MSADPYTTAHVGYEDAGREAEPTAARSVLSPACVHHVVVWDKGVILPLMAAGSMQARRSTWFNPPSAPPARRACRIFRPPQPARRSRSSVGPARATAALATAITASRRQIGRSRGRLAASAEGPMAGVGVPPPAERPALPNTPGSKRLQVPDFSSYTATLDQAGGLQSLSPGDAGVFSTNFKLLDCSDRAPA